jgi:hypothetical protein
MSQVLAFHRLFGHVLSRQVEYSYGSEEQSFTAMVPLGYDLLPRAMELAALLEFSGEWAWAIQRFSEAVRPDTFLLRLDGPDQAASSITLYCRFPSEPDDTQFRSAVRSARPFNWNGPATSRIAEALGLPGPRGMAFRTDRKGALQTAIYFRTEEHAGPSWVARLPALLAACGYQDNLAGTIESDLKALYGPGPIGVIGLDNGSDGLPATLKFDPSNVPVARAIMFLKKIGVPASRISTLAGVATGLRAESVSYLGIKYKEDGLAGWRLYFSCEPSYCSSPAGINVAVQRSLRPIRRIPHY